MLKIVHCPHCKKEVVWSQDFPFRPFCSERCRLIDLGAWADGSYAIPSVEGPKEGLDQTESKDDPASNDDSFDDDD